MSMRNEPYYPKLFVLLLVLIFSTSLVQSQESGYKEQVLVDLVDLFFTATDKKGNFITDLRQDEIFLEEDGVPQKLHRFSNFEGMKGEVPMTVAFMVDNSGSMYDDIEGLLKIDMAKETGIMLSGELGPYDRMMLITFDETPQVTRPISDRAALEDQVRKVRIRFGHTALFDAISTTIDEMQQEYGRHILVICSDGVDNLSKTDLESVLKKMSETTELTTVILGTIARHRRLPGYKTINIRERGKDTLQQMADRTAGYAYFPETLKEVEKVKDLIRSFVRSQYSLAYRSTNRNMDGKWRKITLRTKRKNVTLHYRNGYFAPKEN